MWFVGAADELSFKPRKWCFPIVGCFAGVGFFDEDDAVAFEQKLEGEGYDAHVRPAAAYSTGGWFPDPVLSTMLGGGDDALPELANVILHESVHATVLIPDEPFFNESIAEYVADALTDHWIEIRFGPGSPEEVAWTLGQALHYPRTARTLAAYDALKAVYASKQPRDAKLAEKAKIIDDARRRSAPAPPAQQRDTYRSEGLQRRRRSRCSPRIARAATCASLLEAAKTLKRADFASALQDDLTPIATILTERCQATQKTGARRHGASR